MGKKEEIKERDFWGKLEAWAKFLGGLGAVVGAVLIPWILHLQSERNQKVQVYAEIMSQREAKDTEIRAKMFDSLLAKYLDVSSSTRQVSKSEGRVSTPDAPWGKGPQNPEDKIKVFNDKIVFLSILMENFQEYFNARPLFEDLYEQIDNESENSAYKRGDTLESDHAVELNNDAAGAADTQANSDDKSKNPLNDLQGKLIKLSGRIASKQTEMLSRIGLVTEKIKIKEGCKSSTFIPLFKTNDLPRDYYYISEELSLLSNLKDNDCIDLIRDNGEGSVSGDSADDTGKEAEWWSDSGIIKYKKRYSPSERMLHAITVKVKEIAYPKATVEINLYKYELFHGNPRMKLTSVYPFSFSVSFFDMPYMDNTRICDGERFALVLKAICSEGHRAGDECRSLEMTTIEESIANLKKQVEQEDIHPADKTALENDIKRLNAKLEDAKNNLWNYAVFKVVTFGEEYMSLRDRPLFEEMLNKLQK